MNIQISSDNMELTESMKVLARKKLKKLERRWKEIDEDHKSVRVVMNKGPEEDFLVKMEATIDGKNFYTEEPGYELETALIDTVEEMDRKYLKFKEKMIDSAREDKRDLKRLSEEDLEKEIEESEDSE